MGEARILLRDAADLTAAVPAEVERKLTVLELLWNDGFVRKTVIIIFLAAVWEVYGTHPRQSAAVPDLPRHHPDACSTRCATAPFRCAPGRR